jgi:NitT/TauT family transport system substrate-binding protein
MEEDAMKRSLSSLLVLCAALLFAPDSWFSARSQSNVDTTPLRIGLNIWPGYGAFFIAEEKGLFKSEGVQVEIQIIQNDPDREAALVAGRLDAIGMTIDNMVILRDRGIDVRAVYKYDGSAGADGIVVRNEIKSLADLKGKKVGWAPGTTSHFFLAVALTQVRLRTSDLQHVSLSADDAGAAFAAGNLDAAVTWEPWLSKAKETGKGYALLTTRELPVIEDVLFFRKEVLTKRREDVLKFLRACFAGVAYWKAHPDEAVEIIAKKLGMPAPEVRDMLGGIQVMDLAENVNFFGDGTSKTPAYKAYELAVKTWIGEKVVKKAQEPGDALETTFVRQLQQ